MLPFPFGRVLATNSAFGYLTLSIQSLPYTKINEFHEQLNKQTTSIQFAKEIVENGKIPFLYWLTKRLIILLHTKRLLYEP